MVGTQNIETNEALAQTLKGVVWGGNEVQNGGIDVDDKYVLGLTWDTPLNGLRLGGTYQHIKMDMISVMILLNPLSRSTEQEFFTMISSRILT